MCSATRFSLEFTWVCMHQREIAKQNVNPACLHDKNAVSVMFTFTLLENLSTETIKYYSFLHPTVSPISTPRFKLSIKISV